MLRRGLVTKAISCRRLMSGGNVVLVGSATRGLSLSTRLKSRIRISFLAGTKRAVAGDCAVVKVIDGFDRPTFGVYFTVPVRLVGRTYKVSYSKAMSMVTRAGGSSAVRTSLGRLVSKGRSLIVSAVRRDVACCDEGRRLPFKTLLVMTVVIIYFSFVGLIGAAVAGFLSEERRVKVLRTVNLDGGRLVGVLYCRKVLCSIFTAFMALILKTKLNFLYMRAITGAVGPCFCCSFP